MPTFEEMQARVAAMEKPPPAVDFEAMQQRVAAMNATPEQAPSNVKNLPPSLRFVAGMFGRRKVLQDYGGRVVDKVTGGRAGVSAEEQARNKEVMKLAKEHGGAAFNAGDFVAQEAALAPIGLFGRGARTAHAAVKGKQRMRAAQVTEAADRVAKQAKKIAAKKNKAGLKQMTDKLARLEDKAEAAAKAAKSGRLKSAQKVTAAAAAPATVAATEGAISGALAAGEGNRAQGAIAGALTGGTLAAAGQMGTRLGTGVVKKSPEAIKLQKSLGPDAPKIPLLQASGPGAGAAIGRGLFNIGTWASPTARRKMGQQSEDVWNAIYKKHIRDSAPPGSKGVHQAERILDETGDQRRALDTVLEAQAPPQSDFPQLSQRELLQLNMTPNQQVINRATPQSNLGRYSGNQLARADVQAARVEGLPDSAGPMREEAELIQNVMGQAPHARGVLGDPYSRGRPTPKSELTGATMASHRFQNWLMGDARHQQAWKQALANRDESAMMQILNLFRNTVAAEAGGMGAEG